MKYFSSNGSAGSCAKVALLVLGGLAGALAVGTAGAAGTDSGAPFVVVKYSEQSLSTDGGVNDLYRRIMYAAAKVCPDSSIHDLVAQAQIAQCRSKAATRAIRQIDNSKLAALYATHSKNG